MSRHKGKIYEQWAANRLQNAGYQIVKHNFSCYQGEIDIIALNNKQLIFVEVKYRSNLDYGLAQEHINASKIKRLRISAQVFLRQNPKFSAYACRFDVMVVNQRDYKWLKSAF